MAGPSKVNKGKGPARRVSIANEDNTISPPNSPAATSHYAPPHRSAVGSPSRSQASYASALKSRPESRVGQSAAASAAGGAAAGGSGSNQPATTPAPSVAAPTPIPASAPPQTMPHVTGGWRPVVHAGGYGAPYFMMAGQQNPPRQPPANPGNPPDEMGDPPPPPPPQIVPHTLNPHGTYYYPGVPSTELGPMVHRYVPRHDVPGHPGVFFASGQMQGGFMANGTMHMQAGITAPISPVIIHQQHPTAQPMMIQNHSIPGGPPLMLPATNYQAINPAAVIGTQAIPTIPGIVHPLPHQQQQQQQRIHHQVHVQPSVVAAAVAAGLPAQPPIHIEPVSGIGLTPGETAAQNVRIAQGNKAYEPQDFKPADPDPYRLYWFRELNGHWAVFPRRQIDRLDARWFRTDEGVFYAVRVSD
ncbi:uncharacterized protein C8A04DRAFT_35216 [Dichotomopilus funicola]|uniref:Uncharacterized protein n=1 Tax=Dichotomopilus funicola TaxID=1934379 RepID=A0AAN6V7D6_9PEZI|nr:hypothetical protein C8A04DRAFT_35216 [Dichotomopilus funicola]